MQNETTKPTAIAILGEGYTITVTPAAEQQKQVILDAARRIVAVTDQDSCDIAQARMKGLASIRTAVEASRTEVKKPVLELGRHIDGIAKDLKPGKELTATITRADGSKESVKLHCRIDTVDELEYYRHGGILQYVMRQIMNDGTPSRKAA